LRSADCVAVHTEHISYKRLIVI